MAELAEPVRPRAMHRRRRWVLAAALIVLAAALALLWPINASRHAAELLSIHTLPASAESVTCKSYGFTDVLERCYFRIAPADFPKLLVGRAFSTLEACPTLPGRTCIPVDVSKTSHGYGGGPDVGPAFLIGSTYLADPAEGKHGGLVTLITDSTRRQVLVDLYLE